MSAMLAIHTDGLLPEESGGTVRLRDGAYSRFSIDYDFTEAHWEAFRAACKEMARIAVRRRRQARATRSTSTRW